MAGALSSPANSIRTRRFCRSYGDFLDEVLACEVDARRSRYLRARLQLAHLPFVKTFEQFDFAFQPSIDERQIRDLRTLRFVHEASNVILLGPPDPETFCTSLLHH